MKKISYVFLQKKYHGHVVALDKEEKQVIAYGKKFSELFKKLGKKHVNPRSVVFVGPLQKSGTINVYRLSLPLDPYSELFRYKLIKKQKVTIGRIEGRGVSAYPFTMVCRIRDKSFKLRSYFLESRIDPLLGRLDFWNLYSITFDNLERRTSLIPIF